MKYYTVEIREAAISKHYFSRQSTIDRISHIIDEKSYGDFPKGKYETLEEIYKEFIPECNYERTMSGGDFRCRYFEIFEQDTDDEDYCKDVEEFGRDEIAQEIYDYYHGDESAEKNAIKKAIEISGFEPTEERITEWMDDNTVSINTARNGREVAWLLLDGNESAVYVDDLSVLTSEEIEEELM